MTQQDDITQRVLTDDELMALLPGAVRLPPGWKDTARAIESVVLSKLRAPVADERAQDVDLPWLRAYMHHQIASDRWVVTADQARDFARAAVLADRQARDALASAPVADEQFKAAFPNGVLTAARFHELWESAGHNPNPDRTLLENLAWQVGKFAGLVAKEASAPVAGEAQPVCWIEKDVLESVRDEGSDAWVYWRPADHVAEHDEMPLYAAPQASAGQVQAALQKSFDMGKFYGSLPETDAEDVRNAALEEAAAICDSMDNHANPMTSRDCADAIRALKQPQADKDGGQP